MKPINAFVNIDCNGSMISESVVWFKVSMDALIPTDNIYPRFDDVGRNGMQLLSSSMKFPGAHLN